MSVRVGIVGVGNMGRAALEAVRDAGGTVSAFDVTDDAKKWLKSRSIHIASSPASLANDSDTILLFLPGPEQVRGAVSGPDGLTGTSLAGKAIIDLSTVDPDSTRARADECSHAGAIGYLDAPVLGRPDRAGKWTLPVGGTTETLAYARPVLELLATRILHVGDTGMGNVVKLLNNLMFGAINTATAEIMAAATQLGLSRQVLFEAIAESGAATVSNLFLSVAPRMINGDFSPIFRVELLHKDMRLGIETVKRAGGSLPGAEANQLLNDMALGDGLVGNDSSVVVRSIESRLGQAH